MKKFKFYALVEGGLEGKCLLLAKVHCPVACQLFYIAPSTHLSPRQESNISLMKACWNELFALGMAQCSHVMNVATILAAIINHLQSSLQEGKVKGSIASQAKIPLRGTILRV